MLSKCFYSKKMMKIEGTHYKKKVLSPKFFSKKSKLDPQLCPKVFKFKKNGHFAPKMAKIAKKSKIKQIFMSILKGLKWFSEKYSREQKALFYHSPPPIFYFFFAV